jgi:hypothetical protein
MGILVNKSGMSDGLGNKLIAWANTCYLLQTRVPGLEFGTWRNPAHAAVRTYRSIYSSISLGYPVRPPGFSSYRGYGILLAERIHVRILGLAGWIPRSYLHDLYDHDIQAYDRDIRGLRIHFFIESLVWLFHNPKFSSCLFNWLQITPDGSKMRVYYLALDTNDEVKFYSCIRASFINFIGCAISAPKGSSLRGYSRIFIRV